MMRLEDLRQEIEKTRKMLDEKIEKDSSMDEIYQTSVALDELIEEYLTISAKGIGVGL